MMLWVKHQRFVRMRLLFCVIRIVSVPSAIVLNIIADGNGS